MSVLWKIYARCEEWLVVGSCLTLLGVACSLSFSFSLCVYERGSGGSGREKSMLQGNFIIQDDCAVDEIWPKRNIYGARTDLTPLRIQL